MVDPTAPALVQGEAVLSQAKQDALLLQQVLTAVQKKDYLGLIKIAVENKDLVEHQVEEVTEAIPLIKAGWKTSEFWVMVCYFGLNVYCVYKGINIPVGDDASVGAAVLSYVAGRHYIKAKQ